MKLYRDELADSMREDLFALLQEAWRIAESNFPEMSHDARERAVREKFEREWDEQEAAVDLAVRFINRVVFGDILLAFFQGKMKESAGLQE